MKQRNGFVSNSSSSSFIAVGFKHDFSDNELFEKLKNIYNGELEGNDQEESLAYDLFEEFVISRDTEIIFGETIAYGLDDYGISNTSLEEIQEIKEEVIKKAESFGMKVKEEDVKLFYGSQYN